MNPEICSKSVKRQKTMGSGVRTGVASKECAKTGVEVPWSTEDEDVSVPKGTWRGEGWGLEIEEGGGVC